MTTEHLERLFFHAGLRLDAMDLRAEQAFHIEVRRRLTKALFSPGIAFGLEVKPDPASLHHVLVRPGVAIDGEGREIILLEQVRLPVRGIPSTRPGIVFGNYVVIEYREEPLSVRSRGCGGSAGDYGEAPTRIRLSPHISIVDAWPSVQSGKIVLGQLDLDPNGCKLRKVITTVRSYASPARQQSVRPVALAGEKDIASGVSKEIRFHIDGGSPSKFTLHLKATQFSSLYYSELGSHTHAIGITTSPTILKHRHTIQAGTTDPGGDHKHAYFHDGGTDGYGIDTNGPLRNDRVVAANDPMNPLFGSGNHTHGLSGISVDFALDDAGHTHTVNGVTAATGATGPSARIGPRLQHLTDLQVAYDGQPITQDILQQLSARPGQAGRWVKLGDPAINPNPLVDDADGTGPIDLIAVGVDVTPGVHTITLSLPNNLANNGGQIHWNLYLE